MDNITYKVFAKTDENGVITAVNSSAFLHDTAGWTEVDEGTGDRYHHAQGHYLPLGLTDGDGLFNYKLEGGAVAERSDGDKLPERERLAAAAEIAECKALLASTDYIAAKLAEGAAAADEYAEQLSQRAAWRARINELEGT